ncbi:hypothetical protein AVEN_208126-1 [Araneus ventricosus]|uniref:Uncharacterized protein n=1 Tax=Araneus ventricosus TaxID=182803 RepID=A0A4Y2I0P4_ARAVE|nr:hypothetical protein AVEN_208126-1 [Araneus ventricosus]
MTRTTPDLAESSSGLTCSPTYVAESNFEPGILRNLYHTKRPQRPCRMTVFEKWTVASIRMTVPCFHRTHTNQRKNERKKRPMYHEQPQFWSH